jgi:hypothetical protein
LNNLGQTVVIYEGQKLKIKEAGPTWTPIPGTEIKSIITDTPPPATETPTPPLPERQTQKAARRMAYTSTAASLTELSSQSSPMPATGTQINQNYAGASPTALTTAVGSQKEPFQLSEKGLLTGAVALAVGGGLLFGLGWLFGAQAKKKPPDGGSV